MTATVHVTWEDLALVLFYLLPPCPCPSPCRQEELKYQLEVRDGMEHLQSALAAVKQEYEVLRIEFERTVASNDQAAPIVK